MQSRHELIHLSEHVNPDYPCPVYLVQFAVDGKPSPPFWSTKKARVEMGEDAWMESLKLEAEAALAENGVSSIVLPN
jgi:hypothetical protein